MEKDHLTKDIKNSAESENIKDEETIKIQKISRIKKIISRALKILLVSLPFILIALFLFYFLFIYLSPREVLIRSYKNFARINSFKYTLQIDLKLSGGIYDKAHSENLNPEEYINLKTSYPSNFKVVGEGSIRKDPSFESESVISLNSDAKKVANLDLVTENRDLYFKINEFLYSDLTKSDLIGNWIKLGGDFWQKKIGISTDTNSGIDVCSKVSKEPLDFLIKNPPIEIIDKLPADSIEGYISYHYKYKINKENLEKFLEARFPCWFNIKEEDLNKVISDISKNLDLGEGDLWISKKANNLYRIGGDIKLTNVGSEGNIFDINFDVTFDNINKPLTITLPEKFVDIENLVQ